jgi:hypothetical protein
MRHAARQQTTDEDMHASSHCQYKNAVNTSFEPRQTSITSTSRSIHKQRNRCCLTCRPCSGTLSIGMMRRRAAVTSGCPCSFCVNSRCGAAGAVGSALLLLLPPCSTLNGDGSLPLPALRRGDSPCCCSRCLVGLPVPLLWLPLRAGVGAAAAAADAVAAAAAAAEAAAAAKVDKSCSATSPPSMRTSTALGSSLPASKQPHNGLSVESKRHHNPACCVTVDRTPPA